MGMFGGGKKPDPPPRRRPIAPRPAATRPAPTKAAAAPSAATDGDGGPSVSVQFLVRRTRPFDAGRIATALQTRFGGAAQCALGGDDGEPADAFAGLVLFGATPVFLLETPMAADLAQAIQTTRSDEKQRLARDLAHDSIVLVHAGLGDLSPIAALRRTLVIADALADEGVVGVLDAEGCQVLDRRAIAGVADARSRATVEDGPAGLMLFVNVVPFMNEDGAWYATKGAHRLGLSDFAFWNDRSRLDHKQTLDLMYNVLMYQQGGGELAMGQTIHMHGTFEGLDLQLGPVTEYADFIAGPGETFLLKPAG